ARRGTRSLVRLDAVCVRNSPSASGGDRVAAALCAWAHRRGFRRGRELLQTRTSVVDLCRATAAELRAGRASADAFAAAVHAGPTRLAALLQPAVAAGRRGGRDDLADAVARTAATPAAKDCVRSWRAGGWPPRRALRSHRRLIGSPMHCRTKSTSAARSPQSWPARARRCRS